MALITVGAGNDTIYIDGSIATLMTSEGSSTVSVGENDTIDAGAGNDRVTVSSGSNLYIVGGDGSDSIYTDHQIYADLTIDGGAGNDYISNGRVGITNGYGGSYAKIKGGNGDDSIFNSGDYTSIDGGGGSDSIVNSGDYANIYGEDDDDSIFNLGSYASISGGDGNDYIYSGDRSFTNIDGGAGNDYINSSGDFSSIYGGSGNDSIKHSGNYSSINGGDGNDSILHSNGSYASINGGDGDDYIRTNGYFSSVDGGSGNDFIQNNGVYTSIYSGSGNDSIFNIGNYAIIDGGDGDESIYSTGNYASINGGDGNDSIFIDNGLYASIYGGSGDDSINNWFGSYANIDGGAGNDSIDNSSAYASIDGGSGDDYIYNAFSTKYTSIDGGAGNDSIYNDGNYASIDGGDGNDSIYNYTSSYVTMSGGKGIDTLVGNHSLETFIHSADTDIIYGFGSGDTLSIESGTVTSSVVSGSDVILMTSNNGSIILKNTALGNVVFNNGWIGYQTVSGSESVSGSTVSGSGSIITATDGNDTIYVDGSIATIQTSSGTSTISVGSNDTIDAGAGNDVVSVISGSNLYIAGGDGDDSIWTGSVDLDYNIYTVYAVSIDGGDGDDYISDVGLYAVIYGGNGSDFIVHGADDLVSYASIYGGDGNDSIGNLGNNTKIYGGSGNDDIDNWGDYASINVGLGNDTIDNWFGKNVSIESEDGNNYIVNQGSYVTINAENENGSYIYNNGAFAIIKIEGGNNYVHQVGRNSTVYSGSGDDSIFNWGEYSRLDGGSGNDSILNDYGDGVTIAGGTGIDTLVSDSVFAETFIHSADTDIIYGFGSGDTLSLESGTVTSSVVSGSDVILTTSNNGSIILKNVSLGNVIINDEQIEYQIDSENGSGSTVSGSGSGSDSDGSNSNGSGSSGSDSNGSNSNGSNSNGSNSNGSNSNGSDSNGSDSNGSNSNGSNSNGSTNFATDKNDTIYVDTRIETIISGSISEITSLYSSVVDAGDGNDRIEILSGDNLYVIGNDGNDSIYNSADVASLSGDSGNDYIQNIDGNLVSMNGGTGRNTLIGANSESDLFVYNDGRDLIQNFDINDSLDIGSHVITSSVVSDDGIILRFDNRNSLNVTIEGVGSENLQIEDGIITYIASEDVDYESIEIFGSDIGSDSPMIVDNSDGMTRRTIIRFTSEDEVISVESNFRTDDIQFAYYGSDGEMYTQPYRGSETRAFVALNDNNAEFVANPHSTENLNYGFGTEGSVDTWNVTLGAGNDMIHIDDVSSGNFDGGFGTDYFHVTKNLTSDVTLTGGSDSWNFYYATSGTVSSQSDQAKVTITDIDFDNGDVILTDAGVQNLTGDFFSQGKFYNFSNARQASVSGAISRNVFDASDIVSNLEMDFSMARFANRSDATIGSSMSIENVVNVIWVNDSASVIELENQTGSILVFTDSNNVGDQLYLGSNFDDTIHAGFNDTIDAGGGNDQIYVGSSTNVIYSAGNDTIMNWNSSAIIDLNDLGSMPSISVSGENLLIGSTTIDQVAGSDVQYRFDDEIGIVRVASNGSLNYGSEITYYAGSILILDTDQDVTIDLSDSTYENISVIDAANGSGADRFIYETGNITIQNGDSTDVIDLSDYSFDEVSAQFTGTGLILTVDNSSLNVEGMSLTSFHFADGTRTADFTNQTF